MLPPDSWGSSDEALNGPATAHLPTDQALNGPATADYDPVTPDQRDDDAQSLSNVRGVKDTDDASTQCDDEEMVIRRYRLTQLKIGSKNFRSLQKSKANRIPPQRGSENNT